MHTVVPFVLLLVMKDKQVLLLKRTNALFANNQYSLVGGKVEKGETFRQAAVREAFEEIGVVIDPEDLVFVHALHRKGTDEELVAFVFKIDVWQGIPYNKEPDKHSTMGWFYVDALPVDIIPANRQMIESSAQGVCYSEHGY